MERDRAIGILERLQSAQSAFYAGDSGAMLKQLLTADISWMVAGNNRIAGTYRGLEEVFGYFRRRSLRVFPTTKRSRRPDLPDLVTMAYINATYEGIPNAEFAIRPRHLALPRAGEADAVQPGS
jgi:ketosteroid isomerase-like protein